MSDDWEPALTRSRTGPGRRRSADAISARIGPAGSGRATAVVRLLALPGADAAALVTATLASGASRGIRGGLPSALYLAAVLLLLAAGGQHRLRICLRASDQVGRVLTATALPALALLAWLPASRELWLALWSGGLVVACRAMLYAGLRAAHRRGLLTEPVAVVGAGTFGAYLAELMREHPELGLWPTGLLDDGPPRRDLAVPWLGSPARLSDVVHDLGIRKVIVCFSSACRDEDIVTLIRASRPLRADVYVVPRLYEVGMAVPGGCLDELWGIPLIRLRRSGQSAAALRFKRAFDVAVSGVLLAVAAPLMLGLAAAVRLRVGRAPLFRQARVTGEGRVVPIMKLRTLTAHDDHDTRWTAAEHAGPFGRWLRARHLDELPQLINVLRGEMSLVGPRPERPHFAEQFSREVPRYAGRTRMPGGLTGWAQVNGLNGDTSIFERARFDNYYVEYWSAWLDLVILARTTATVIRGARQAGS